MPKQLQRALGATQVALACALLISGGLLGVSLWRVLSQPVGFLAQHRVAALLILPKDMKKAAAWTTLEPQLRQMPGIQSLSATDMMPFAQIGRDQGDVSPMGATNTSKRTIANMPSVSADFFATLGIRFLAGRPFTAEEITNRSPVVVINENLAKRFFGSVGNAMGKQLDLGGNPTIVGVTRNVVWQPTLDDYNPGTVYQPLGTLSGNLLIVIAQAHGSPASVASMLKQGIRQALPSSAIVRIATLPEMVRGASVFRAAGAGMVAAFAALALLLAALGVFAITTFIARARLGEYGIRAALGAAPAVLLRFGFQEAKWLLGIGVPIGLLCAWLLGQAIASALYKTPVLDLGLYVAGIAIIAAVVLAAAWGPARRAARTPIRNLIGGGGSQ